MSLSIGIVGLPNVGKSTLFTALTNKGGLAANYPFATIEPNVGIVPVPDDRLEKLAEIDHPAKIVPATVEFVDIAGLVAGASQGEGLGNQFLANIRETDAICEVVRFFSDPDVVHVDGRVNPSSDVETIKTELILADMGTLDKAIPRLEKEAKRDKAGVKKLEVAKKVLEGLNEGHRARTLNLDEDEQAAIYDLHLLTMKPILYIANVDEDALDADLAEIDGCQPVPISAKVEADLAELDPAEAKEYLEAMGLEESGLARLVRSAVMVEKNAEYVQAARTLGYSHLRILFRHILPNVISGAIVYAVSDILMCMLMGAGLSFLGVGVQPPTPEWGAIISGGRSFLFNAPWISIFPGIFLAVTGVGLSLLGDGLAKFFQVKGH